MPRHVTLVESLPRDAPHNSVPRGRVSNRAAATRLMCSLLPPAACRLPLPAIATETAQDDVADTSLCPFCLTREVYGALGGPPASAMAQSCSGRVSPCGTLVALAAVGVVGAAVVLGAAPLPSPQHHRPRDTRAAVESPGQQLAVGTYGWACMCMCTYGSWAEHQTSIRATLLLLLLLLCQEPATLLYLTYPPQLP